MSVTHRLGMATKCLHFSAVLYVLAAVALGGVAFWISTEAGAAQSQRPALVAVAVLCLLLATLVEVAAWGIRRRRLWAWILGLVIFGLYIPSLFLPLGALGLWGLLDAGSRVEMGMTKQLRVPAR